MNQELIEKYKQEIKRFLSGRIRQNLIPLEKANEITRFLASQTGNINSEHDIVTVIDRASKIYDGIEVLAEQEHLQEDSHNKKDLELIISKLATELINQNIVKAIQVMTFANSEKVTLELFYEEFPEYNK